MELAMQTINSDKLLNDTDFELADDYISGGNSDPQLFHQFVEQLHRDVIRNWTDLHMRYDMLKNPAWRGTILALYVSVILIGVISNTIVVYIVASNKSMQNITNIFIANLALSDIGLCVFSLPVQLHYQITDTWIFGEGMCRVIFAAFAVPMYVSTLTILLIAFDRYWLIVFPLKARMTTFVAFMAILLSLTVSILLAVPVVVYAAVHHINQTDLGLYRTYCLEEWPSDKARLVYTLLTFIFQFCLPLVVTALLYYRIYCRLRYRRSQRAVHVHNDRKQKTNKILVAIVTLFVICRLPWNLLSLLAEIEGDIVKGPHFKFLDLLLKVFALGSACINPFLYCWLNENFRKELDLMAITMRILRKPPPFSSPVPHFHVQGPDGSTRTMTDQYGRTMLTDARSNMSQVHTVQTSSYFNIL